MNLLLCEPSELADDGSLVLSQGRRLRHINTVLRLEAGDTLRVGLIGGPCGTATIEAIGPHEAQLRVELHTPPPPPLELTLVLALPRPKMLRRILRGIAELGVKDLHLINSTKVEKSFWQSPLLAQATLRDYLLAGLEQASDTQLPTVHLHQRFRPFAEDLLPALCAGREALLARPAAERGFPSAPALPGLLAVGPEGGFTPFEIALLERAGCEGVTLGPRVLRVETALHCALGRYLAPSNTPPG